VPALAPVSKVLRVGCDWSVSSATTAFTRFYIAYTGTAPTNANLNTFAGSVATAWQTNLQPNTHQSYVFNLVEVEDLTSSTAAVGSITAASAGALTGANVPANCCMVTSYKVARRFRGGHPRGYWPAGDGTKVNNDQTWTPAFVTAWNGALTTFFTSVQAAGWSGAGTLTHVAVSYYLGSTGTIDPVTGRAKNTPTPRPVPLVDVVSLLQSKAIIGSQRGRLR
jgi:hypothetical protein